MHFEAQVVCIMTHVLSTPDHLSMLLQLLVLAMLDNKKIGGIWPDAALEEDARPIPCSR